MTDGRIDPKVIRAAVNGYCAANDCPRLDEAIEAAIRAADRTRGLKEERLDPYPRSTTQFAPQVRLVSDWRPVEQGGEDG